MGSRPAAYIIVAVFALLWEFLFFNSAFLAGEASLRLLFGILPWLLLFFIPAVTMGSIADESREGTLELILTHPVKDSDVILGKFAAAKIFSAAAILLTIPVAVAFNSFGDLDIGAVAGQYIAAIFLACLLAALGIAASSLMRSSVAALLVAAAASFFLIVAGLDVVTSRLPLAVAPVAERVSALSHFESMARGVVDLRDIWYFLSGIAIFLGIAHLALLRRRLGRGAQVFRRHQIAIAAVIALAAITNTVGSRIPGRIDLTEDRIYTLSPITKSTLHDLPGPITMTLYASPLPAPLQPTLRAVEDTLRDYRIYAQGKITLARKNPSRDQAAAAEAGTRGIQPVQFNVVGQEEFKVQQGYLGLDIAYGDKHEAIPFVRTTGDLEYQLTSIMAKLTTTEKKRVVFLTGKGEKSVLSDYRAWGTELEKQFTVEEVSPEEEKFGDARVVVLAGPTQRYSDAGRRAVKDFLSRGGNALFLVDGVAVTPQFLTASANPERFDDILESYGIKVQPALAYDLRSNETVSFSGGFINYLLPYPFWMRSPRTEEQSPLGSRINGLVLAWASPIERASTTPEGVTLTSLFASTRFGGVQREPFFIAPDTALAETDLASRIVAVSATKGRENADVKTSGVTRIVVVGDSDFLTDQFVQNAPENLAFGVDAVSWLAETPSLAGLRIKTAQPRQLIFENKTQIALVKYGTMGFAGLAPALFGAFVLLRRRSLGKSRFI